MQMPVRQSLVQIRTSTILPLTILDELGKNSKDNNWSWTYLKEEFENKNLETLFLKYRGRISNSSIVVLLILNIIFSFTNTVRPITSKIDFSLKTLFVPSGCFVIYVCLFVVSCKEHLLKTYQIFFRVAIVLVLVVEEYATTFTDCALNLGQCCPYRLGNGLYLILLNYLLIPMPQKFHSIIVGFLIVGLEASLSMWFLKIHISQLWVDFCVYFIANAYGVGWLFLEEITERRTFLDLRSGIESNLQLKEQKEQEDKLTLSIIPQFISADVKKAIREAVILMENETGFPNYFYRPFNDLFMTRYTDVSILFADIVQFTKLTKKLDAAQLVEALNDLFGNFDEVVEKNNCMRIKILGDCYYCVSGMPESIPDHANNCVNTGLEMIKIIKEVRDNRNVPELNMRIGINTGSVNSGILGLTKWQFDVWSKDVVFANYLEQTGKPGKIHISKLTKDKLGNAFQYEPHLDESGVETFFILQKRSEDANRVISNGTRYNRRISNAFGTRFHKGSIDSHVHFERRKSFIESGNPPITTSSVNLVLADAIDSMALSKREQWGKQSDINPVCLTFHPFQWEVPFWRERDPLFKYYLLSSFILTCLLFIIGFSNFSSIRALPIFTGSSTLLLILGLSVLIVAWFKSFCIKWKGNLITSERSRNYSETDTDSNNGTADSWPNKVHSIYKRIFVGSEAIIRSLFIRATFCLLVFVIMLLWITFAGLTAVNKVKSSNITNLTYYIKHEMNQSCNLKEQKELRILFIPMDITPRFITYCFALIMMAVSFFLKTHFLMKLSLHILALMTFLLLYLHHWILLPLIWESRFIHTLQEGNWTGAHIDHYIFLIHLLILIHVSDRQVEYLSRLGYIWKRRVTDEKAELALADKVNRILLVNILPVHLANYYLDDKTPRERFFHEQYDNVAVVFACISNFMDSYDENDINENGKACLQELNQIIGEFDKLLYATEFSRIEKIKIIGSTYMAAAGLQPGRKYSNLSQKEEMEPFDAATNLTTITRFAIAVIEQAKNFNAGLQDYQLRIGINHGPVIAGIVGKNKPFYDIWGDTVNIASRMETTGKAGRIQVKKETAEILMTTGSFQCDYRGQTVVKGCEKPMDTYFVCTPFDEIESTNL